MIAVRIREVREEMGISQQMLAEMCHDSQPNVVRWERGEVSIMKLIQIAKALSCSVDDLLAEGGEMDVQREAESGKPDTD